MNDSSTNNFHAIVKQVHKFDGKRAGDFLEWQSKLRTALSLYNRKMYNVLQGQQRPSNEDPDGATARVTWDIANQNLFGVLFFATIGSAFSVADSKERGPKMDQDMVSKPGRPFARNFMAVHERLCVRSITK